MSTVGRAFVAVVPPPEVLDAVEAALAPCREQVAAGRWTAREQLHVTLQFLGNHADVDRIAGALRALSVASGSVRFARAGAFPNERRGRVLWVGAGDGSQLLAQLAGAVGALLRPLGYEPEARPFHAHLTVARFKQPTDLRDPVAGLHDASFGPEWPVDEIVLYHSRTRPAGAEYEVVATVPLARGER